MTDTRTELVNWLDKWLEIAAGDEFIEKLRQFRAFVESAAALEAENERLRAALDVAWNTIRIWHGPHEFDIYDQHSPEMNQINAARRAGGGKDD